MLLKENTELIKRLSDADAPSGFEGKLRQIIKEELENYVDEIKVDRLGNVIVHKEGKGKKLLLNAHMDEAGFIITGFNEDGTLRFDSIGEIETKAVPSKLVRIGDSNIKGVIGVKPVHLQSKEERDKSASFNNLCIDIGVDSSEEAKRIIELGEYAVFHTEFSSFGGGYIRGKALDNRLGCAALIEVLKGEYKNCCDLYASFNVQRQIGTRGAYTAAYKVNPDICITIETEEALDILGVPENKLDVMLNKGAVISLMDKNTLYSPEIIEEIKALATYNNIPYQFKKRKGENGDSLAISLSREGIKVAQIGIPARYINTPVNIASIEDYLSTIRLIKTWLKNNFLGEKVNG